MFESAWKETNVEIADLKNEFSFLVNHQRFQGGSMPSLFSTQYFFTFDFDYHDGFDAVKCHASFGIPFSNDYKSNWFYSEVSPSFRKEYKQLERTPDWFQELYQEVLSTLEKRKS